MLTGFRAALYFELLLVWRRAQEWLYPLTFFLMIISLIPFAFSPDPLLLESLIPGGVWLAALFANLLAITTLFQTELEEGYLEQWLFSPIALPCLVFAKLIAYWLTTALPLIILTPFIGWLFHLPTLAIWILMLSLLLGTPMLTMIGSLGAALTLGLRQQGVVLSLLILPLLTPVLIFGVNIVMQAQAGFEIKGPLFLLAGLMFLCLSATPFAIAAALRTGMDD